MTDSASNNPGCSMCGYCCRAPIALTMAPEDYERWKRQGRSDILRYASTITPEGDGALWIDADEDKELSYCPFLKKVGDDKHICTIQDTKPKVCREFWCEWCYGVGEQGIPFRTELGWTYKARRLGYE